MSYELHHELQVVSCDFKKIDLFLSFEFFFTSWKEILRGCTFILRIGNQNTTCKLLFADCGLLFRGYKFKGIILRVASCVFMKVLKNYFTSCQFLFTRWKFKTINLRVESLGWCLPVAKLPFTSWTFTMPILKTTITWLNQISRE